MFRDMDHALRALDAADRAGEEQDAKDIAAIIRQMRTEQAAPEKQAEPEVDYHQQMIDEMPWYEKGAVAVGRGFMDTAQGVKQLGLQAGEWMGLVDEGEADKYTAEKTKELELYRKLEEDSPYLTGTGRLIGGVASAPIPGAGVGATLGRRALSSAAVGSVAGGTQFVEEDGSRLANVAIGGVLGGAGQGALEKGSVAFKRAAGNVMDGVRRRVGNDVVDSLNAQQREALAARALEEGIPLDEVTDGLLTRWTEDARQATGTALENASPLEREFQYPLTRGQRVGDDAVLGAEDSLRYGRRGQSARDLMLTGQREQEKRAAEIVEEFRSKMGGDSTPLANRSDAGAALREGVRARAAAEKAEMKSAYDAALSANPGLKATDMRDLTKIARKALDEGDDLQLPETAKVLRNLKDLGKKLKKADDSVLYGLKDIEMQRKRMNTALSSATMNPADKRQVSIIKQAFDDSIDDAVAKGLFQGDAEAIGQLKGARKMAADYYRKFNGKVDEGRFIKKLIEENPTDAQVVNSLFTTTNFSKGAAGNLAKRYKEILGPGSKEWNQVRQAAVDTLIKRTTSNAGDKSIQAVSGTQTLKAIRNAMESNAGLMKEIFSPEEIAEMRRFAVLVQKSQPTAKNPSGSASTLIEEGLKAAAASGSPIDTALAGTGNFAVLAAKKAGEFMTGYIRERGATNAAAEAFRPFKKTINGRDYVPSTRIGSTFDTGLEIRGRKIGVGLDAGLGSSADQVQEDLR